MPAYRKDDLHTLLKDRHLFEHWTHDAAVIPVEFLPYWLHRAHNTPLKNNVEAVYQRIKNEGPLASRDFESDHKTTPWWGWKPEKVALESLWRCGRLSITARRGFEKIYDLTERAFPNVQPIEDRAQYLDWAFEQALTRLGAATPAELAQFWAGATASEATKWIKSAAQQQRIELIPGFGAAVKDWRERLDNPPKGVHILNPFDPLVRDRKRLLRLFNFDYRFEAYVPAPKRKYGYYTLPVLKDERFIARIDAKFHRAEGRLEIKNLHWENPNRPLKALDTALAKFEQWLAQ